MPELTIGGLILIAIGFVIYRVNQVIIRAREKREWEQRRTEAFAQVDREAGEYLELGAARDALRSAVRALDRPDDVPEDQSRWLIGRAAAYRPGPRECCFFCSRPLTPEQRHRSPIDLLGQACTVTACASHVTFGGDQRTARVRGEVRSGRMVPWFAIADYDPYRDYTPDYAPMDLTLLNDDELRIALGFADPLMGSSSAAVTTYSDDSWDRRYRDDYWDRHQQWEYDRPWERSSAAETPLRASSAAETRLAGAAAAETAFVQGPTAAEAAYAARLAESQRGSPRGEAQSSASASGARDTS